MPKIHCIGDSHLSVFSGHEIIVKRYPAKSRVSPKYSYFEPYRLGPHTAYNIWKRSVYIHDIIDKIEPDDWILLLFGCIDCKSHLVYHSLSRDRQSVISECVERYFDVIKVVHKHHHNLIIHSVFPYVEKEKVPKWAVILGTLEERMSNCRIFNQILKSQCDHYNIYFLDVMDELLIDGLPNHKYYLKDGFHRHPVCLEHIKEKLCNDLSLPWLA